MIDLYEHDFVRWTEEQARAIREGRLDALDHEHLAEEIEGMGGSDRSEIISRLAVIIHHLLKQRVQPELDGRSWRSTLYVQRSRIARLIAQSPSLRPFLDEAFARALPVGIRYAELEMGIYADRFELELITLADALGDDFDKHPQCRDGGRVREGPAGEGPAGEGPAGEEQAGEEQAGAWSSTLPAEAPAGGGA